MQYKLWTSISNLYFPFFFANIKYVNIISKKLNCAPFWCGMYKFSVNYLWIMWDMVKYRASLWSFLKLTALVFYNLLNSPWNKLYAFPVGFSTFGTTARCRRRHFTMFAFSGFCPKLKWDKSHYYAPLRKKSKKNKGSIFMSIFKVVIREVPLFFQILYLLLPKIEICRRYFLAKNSPKQPLWHCRGKENWRSPVQLWSLFLTMAVFGNFCPESI